MLWWGMCWGIKNYPNKQSLTVFRTKSPIWTCFSFTHSHTSSPTPLLPHSLTYQSVTGVKVFLFCFEQKVFQKSCLLILNIVVLLYNRLSAFFFTLLSVYLSLFVKNFAPLDMLSIFNVLFWFTNQVQIIHINSGAW